MRDLNYGKWILYTIYSVNLNLITHKCITLIIVLRCGYFIKFWFWMFLQSLKMLLSRVICPYSYITHTEHSLIINCIIIFMNLINRNNSVRILLRLKLLFYSFNEYSHKCKIDINHSDLLPMVSMTKRF